MKEKTLKKPPAIYKPHQNMVGYTCKRGVAYGLNQRFASPNDSNQISFTNLGPGSYVNTSNGDIGHRSFVKKKDILRIKMRAASTEMGHNSSNDSYSCDYSTIKIMQTSAANLNHKQPKV
jgi:hypothetical protein